MQDIDEAGYNHRTQVRAANLTQEWRALRFQGLLEGLGQEVFIWQQVNAYSDDNNMKRLFELFRKQCNSTCIARHCALPDAALEVHDPALLEKDAIVKENGKHEPSMIGVYDAFSPHWSDSTKESARHNGILGVCVAIGLTMPGQLTDTDFALCKKSSEAVVRAELLREKQDRGLPRIFTRYDFHRLVLAQHRATVQRNKEENAVILGCRRIGLLSRWNNFLSHLLMLFLLLQKTTDL